MIRNLKALGLALVAMLAFGAMVASAAQAAEAHFTAEEGTTKITGHNETLQNQAFSTDNGTIECDGTFSSENEPLTTTTLTVKAEYKNCKEFPPGTGIIPVVNMGGCHYTFHAGTFNAAPEGSTGTADVVCDTEGNKFIEINAGGACITRVKAQNGLGPIHFNNTETEGTETVTVEPTVENIAYEWEGFFCPAGFSGSNTNGTYHGPVTVEGENNEGIRKDVTITST